MNDSDFRRIMHAELKRAHDDFMQMEARALAAEKKLAEHSKPCVWRRIDDDGDNSTWMACDGWRFPQYVKEDCVYCPRCGHLVE